MMVMPTQAQFLKNLGKKITKNAERKLSDKTESKANEKIDKSLEGVFSVPSKIKTNAEKPRGNYNFTYHYQLDVKSDAMEDSFNFDYYLKPDATYTGMAINQQGANVFMIIDLEKKAMYNFMDSDGEKIMMALSVDSDGDEEEDIGSWIDEDEMDGGDFTVSDLPSKVILGYTCQGKKLVSDEWEMDVYYTTEVPISMASIFNSNTKGVDNPATDVIKEKVGDMENALMMEMKGVSKKDASQNIHMVCTKLEQINRDFDSSAYKTLF